MKLIKQMSALNLLSDIDVVILNSQILAQNFVQLILSKRDIVFILRSELGSIYAQLADQSISNLILATFDRDYQSNMEKIKSLELRKIGVLSLKEFPDNSASLESLFNTISSLRFKNILCLLDKKDVIDFLSVCNPNESFVFNNENIVPEKFIGTKKFHEKLNIKLIVC